MNSTSPPKKTGRSAFTLVELLVVIAIIALLIAILLPVLAKVKRKAQQVGCASAEKQIYMAMIMFTNEHKGHLHRPYTVGEMSSDPVLLKLSAWLQEVPNASGHIDMNDEKGALWPYLKGKETRQKVLMCPGDEGETLLGWPRSAAYPRNVSYSLNSYIRRDDPPPAQPRLGLQITRVKESSARIMIYEELAPNDAWCIMGDDPADVPSGRHGTNMKDAYRNVPTSPAYKINGRGNFCFFDGHVESLSTSDLLRPSDGGKIGSERYHFPLVRGERTTW